NLSDQLEVDVAQLGHANGYDLLDHVPVEPAEAVRVVLPGGCDAPPALLAVRGGKRLRRRPEDVVHDGPRPVGLDPVGAVDEDAGERMGAERDQELRQGSLDTL